jgi:CubicO group peptidase (beta-lactamase class C family)
VTTPLRRSVTETRRRFVRLPGRNSVGLCQGSGLRHYTGPVPAIGELFAAGIRADRPAGQWSYSNLAFVALAALAADLLGAPFGQCLHEWVLGPLGLAESVSLQQLPPGRQLARSPAACGHAATRDRSSRSDRARSWPWAQANSSPAPAMPQPHAAAQLPVHAGLA